MDTQTINIVKNVLFFLILVFVFLIVLTWSNVVPCSHIPGWCSIYWKIMGPPRVLIAYGDDGLGSPEKLKYILEDRSILGIHPNMQNIKYITPNHLKKYDLVIVTRAKTMSAEKMEMFYDFAKGGGRLIWTGDAGTLIPEGEKRPEDFNFDSEGSIWVRITKEGHVVAFNKLISVDYIDNYCNVASCKPGKNYVGNLKSTPDSVFSYQLPPKSQFYGDFALTTPINNVWMSVDLWLDYKAELVGTDVNKSKFGDTFPVIVLSNNKIVYSATPLEYFVDVNVYDHRFDAFNTGMFYPTILINMYEFLIEKVT